MCFRDILIPGNSRQVGGFAPGRGSEDCDECQSRRSLTPNDEAVLLAFAVSFVRRSVRSLPESGFQSSAARFPEISLTSQVRITAPTIAIMMLTTSPCSRTPPKPKW